MVAWKAGRSSFAPPTIRRSENMDVKFLGFTGVNPAYGSQLLRDGTGAVPNGGRDSEIDPTGDAQ